MNRNYKQLYNDLIGEKFRSIIISYNPQSGQYTYCGYSHKVEDNALDSLSQMIIDDLVFYAFSENEVLKLNTDMKILDDLRTAAKYAYVERLPKRTNPKTDGTLGEVLLDIFIQLESANSKKLIARAKHSEVNNAKEITGYDALYFTLKDDEICLWLGQAKAGGKTYCKSSITKDLQEKYQKEYFANTVFYVADKNEAEELNELLRKINRICFDAQVESWDSNKKIDRLIEILGDANVKIKIPCLITYTQDIYGDKDKLKSYIEQEVAGIIHAFDKMEFQIDIELNYEIVFYILPVKDLDYIRDQIIDLKKETV